ncbi:acyl-CoA dehydrogenase family protein [Actinomycetes bacterium KLBMP 9797]
MDFDLTEAQRDLAALTGAIAASAGDSLWTDLARAGVLAAGLPERAGGDGYGVLERCAVLVELGRAAAPVPYLPSIATAAAALARFGTDAQVARWAAPAGRGEVVLTAADGAFDAAGGRLSGTATAVPALPAAAAVLVPTGAGVFVVTPTDEGVTVAAQDVAGGPGAGQLTLDAVPVDDDRLLGGAEGGAEVSEWLRAHATVGACAAQLGVCERALELTAEYARTRVQFGRAIGSFQAVAQRLADAYIDVAAIRLTLWHAAWRLSEGLPCAREVSTAKFWAADAGHRVAHTAVHVHGGVGIDLSAPVHRYFLAAKYHEFTSGGATAHLRALGTRLS